MLLVYTSPRGGGGGTHNTQLTVRARGPLVWKIERFGNLKIIFLKIDNAF